MAKKIVYFTILKKDSTCLCAVFFFAFIDWNSHLWHSEPELFQQMIEETVAMKIRYFLYVILLFICSQISANHTGKTHLSIHNNHSYHLIDPLSLDRWVDDVHYPLTNASLKIVGFYNNSTNENGLGRYFGVNNSNSIRFDERVGQETDVFLGYLLHADDIDDDQKQTMVLKPQFKSAGMIASALFSFPKIFKGLSFSMVVPFTSVTTDINSKFCDTQDEQLRSYLFGNFQSNDPVSLQAALTRARFSKEMTASGLADIELYGSYAWQKCDYFIRLGAGLVIPTGNQVTGCFLFEPIYGNGDHVGLSWFADATYLWCEWCGWQWYVSGSCHFRYLLETEQCRTFSIKGRPFSQYYLLGKKGNENKPLIPAANVTTLQVDVTGGNNFEALLSTSLRHKTKGMSLEIGYMAFVYQGECIKLNKDCVFDENTYAIAEPSFDTRTVFGDDEGDFDCMVLDDFLRLKDLDIDSAQSPGSASHKIFATFRKELCMNPLSGAFDLHAFYETIASNAGIELWGIAAGFSMLF